MLKVITPPAFEPVTIAEARDWCRIDESDTSQDAMLLLLIIGMREYAEALTGRAFVSRTLEYRLDSFPDGVIELPMPPLLSVSSFQYLNADGVQTLEQSPTGWQEDKFSEPARLAPLLTTGWPATSDELGAVRIQYVAGYSNISQVPKKLRLWMQSRIATLFEFREQVVIGGMVNVPRAFVDGLLDDLKVVKNFA